MKKIFMFLTLVLCITMLSACGKTEVDESVLGEVQTEAPIQQDDKAAGSLDENSGKDDNFEVEIILPNWSLNEQEEARNEMNRIIEEEESWRPSPDAADADNYEPKHYEVDFETMYKDNGYSFELYESFLDDYKYRSFDIFKYQYKNDENVIVSNHSVMNSMASLLYGATDTGSCYNRLNITNWFECGGNDLPIYILDTMQALASKYKSQKEFTFNNLIGSVCEFRRKFTEIDELNTLNTDIDYEEANPYEFINNYFNDITAHIVFTNKHIVDNTYVASVGMFQDEWVEPVKSYIVSHDFVGRDGTTYDTKLSYFDENLDYIESETAYGCIKPFSYGNYSFVVILPKEASSFSSYVENFSVAEYDTLINSMTKHDVSLYLPNVAVKTEVNLNDYLKQSGLNDLFSDATTYYTYTVDDMTVNYVLHKSYFSLNGRGAKSYDNVKNVMEESGIVNREKVVCCDRPFMYMIIDNDLKLPVMIGTVVNTDVNFVSQ